METNMETKKTTKKKKTKKNKKKKKYGAKTIEKKNTTSTSLTILFVKICHPHYCLGYLRIIVHLRRFARAWKKVPGGRYKNLLSSLYLFPSLTQLDKLTGRRITAANSTSW